MRIASSSRSPGEASSSSGEPYFTAGRPDRARHEECSAASSRATSRSSRTGRGRAGSSGGLGTARRIENVLEALLVEQGHLGRLEPYELPPETLEARIDLRGLPTITIDPETAKDFDDALSFAPGARRNPCLGPHRRRVVVRPARYVRSTTGASERAVSTYVPGLVAPMLPHELADDACSLRPHEDRLCVTVEMPPDGEPVFYRSVINSDARLTYGQAERRDAPPEILEQLDLAGEVATALRGQRGSRAGALEINTPEVAFSFADGRVDVGMARVASRTRTCSSRS